MTDYKTELRMTRIGPGHYAFNPPAWAKGPELPAWMGDYIKEYIRTGPYKRWNG